MISFIQLCELLTHHQKHSWFYLDESYIDVKIEGVFTPEELDTCYWQQLEGRLFRVWYPKEKFFLTIRAAAEQNRREAQLELNRLKNEIFPADLPTMRELIDKRISASLKEDYAELRKIDNLIALRARKDCIK